MNLVERAIIYAQSCHERTNHLYDGHPYAIHLVEVVAWAEKFNHWIPKDMMETIMAACWCHDIIEDCRETYNDVLKATSPEVADIVYALTNEKGKTREERANEKYYHGILTTPCACFIKLCDRLANVQYSKDTNSKMLEIYRKEHEHFFRSLSMRSRFDGTLFLSDMWGTLNRLLL